MKYNLVEEKNWHRKLEITIPEEDVNKKFDEVWNVLKKEAKIPGFRPGKAPINIIKSRYGKLAEKEVLETIQEKDEQRKAIENILMEELLGISR